MAECTICGRRIGFTDSSKKIQTRRGQALLCFSCDSALRGAAFDKNDLLNICSRMEQYKVAPDLVEDVKAAYGLGNMDVVETVYEIEKERGQGLDGILGYFLNNGRKSYYLFNIDKNSNYTFRKYRGAGGMETGDSADKEFFGYVSDKVVCSMPHNQVYGTPLEDAQGVLEIAVPPIELVFRAKEDEGECHFYIENSEDNAKKIDTLASFFLSLGIKNFFNIMDIPVESFPVSVLAGNGFMEDAVNYQMMRQEDSLYFIRVENRRRVLLSEIKLSEIQYYRQEGSLVYENRISGGGGMGVNFGGAIVGGILFGGAGALIGSRVNRGVKSVESNMVEHDSRLINLVIMKNNIYYQIGFSMENESAFDWLIPEKQYDHVIEIRRKNYIKQSAQAGISSPAVPLIVEKKREAAVGLHCPKCGNRVTEGAAFCGKCGNKLI